MKRWDLTLMEGDVMNETQWNIMRHVQRLDGVSISYEARWGVNRLQGLASDGLKEKWDRQWQKLDQAIADQDIRLVEDLCAGCIRAWGALEAEAIANGHKTIESGAWEVKHPESGQVYRIARNNFEAGIPAAKGTITYSLEEVARILESNQLINVVKETFEGAVVKSISDTFDWKKGDSVEF